MQIWILDNFQFENCRFRIGIIWFSWIIYHFRQKCIYMIFIWIIFKITKNVRNRKVHPWYDDELRILKLEVRKRERSKNKICNDSTYRDHYKAFKAKYNSLLSRKKAEFYNSKISENESDQKCLFEIVNKLQNKKRTTLLPDHISQKSLANEFSVYFKDKIDKIVDSFTPDSDANASDVKDIPTFGIFWYQN